MPPMCVKLNTMPSNENETTYSFNRDLLTGLPIDLAVTRYIYIVSREI